MEVSEIFAERVSKRLEELDWTQGAFADKLGIARTAITKVLVEKRAPRIDTLIRWAEVLQVSPQWLLGTDSVPPPAKILQTDEIESLLKLAASAGASAEKLDALRFVLEADRPALKTLSASIEALRKLDLRRR